MTYALAYVQPGCIFFENKFWSELLTSVTVLKPVRPLMLQTSSQMPLWSRSVF